MQALKLSKKYPEFKQDEIFDLVNKFKYVQVRFLSPIYSPSRCPLPRSPLFHGFQRSFGHLLRRGLRPCLSLTGTDFRQIDVDDKGSLDKAAVIAALGQSGDADYDSVSPLHFSLAHIKRGYTDAEGKKVYKDQDGHRGEDDRKECRLMNRLERLSRM
jgi:hypothetical protein